MTDRREATDGNGADTLSQVPEVLRRYRYRPRAIAFRGVRAVGRWRVKCTVITVRGTAAHFDEEIEAAWVVAEAGLGEAPDRGLDAGVAFVTIHVGLAGVWLLLDWWEEGDRLRHRGFLAPLDDPTRFSELAREPAGPDVWDLAVQAHEREAWLRHVLANPAGPDLEAYLADGLTASL